jgi:hypothetical protein
VRIDGIIWLENVERKIWEKHRVQPDEVEAVLESDPHVRFVERGASAKVRTFTLPWAEHAADDT